MSPAEIELLSATFSTTRKNKWYQIAVSIYHLFELYIIYYMMLPATISLLSATFSTKCGRQIIPETLWNVTNTLPRQSYIWPYLRGRIYFLELYIIGIGSTTWKRNIYIFNGRNYIWNLYIDNGMDVTIGWSRQQSTVIYFIWTFAFHRSKVETIFFLICDAD
jgi:hypothetical protein